MDGGWGGTISVGENFCIEKNVCLFCDIIVQYCNKEERWDNFLIVQTEFTLDLNPYPFDLK